MQFCCQSAYNQGSISPPSFAPVCSSILYIMLEAFTHDQLQHMVVK